MVHGDGTLTPPLYQPLRSGRRERDPTGWQGAFFGRPWYTLGPGRAVTAPGCDGALAGEAELMGWTPLLNGIEVSESPPPHSGAVLA